MFQDLGHGIRRARRDQQLYFAALLSEQTITDCFRRASQTRRSDAVYSFPMIVWMFLSQVLSSDHSCRETVARLNAWRAGQGESPGSSGTGRYCTMRDQLCEAGCQQLVETTARGIDEKTPTEWLWQGHRVCVVDGTTVTMPDTPENQSEYPQQSGQKPGCGQPIMRLVALFTLASGVMLRLAMGPYRGKQTGENSMFREHLAEALDDGDVLLADRCFSGWFDIALLQQRGVEIVVRKHQLRHTDFRCGARLASGDHLVKWYKPLRPEWMKPSEHDALPEFLVIREVRIRVPKRGFRTREIIVVTTLWHHEEYPASAITELYRRRWDAEINLRSLKTHMQMDHLRCKKPHRVRNEVRMHVLAYNLIRGVMLASAIDDGVQSWQISFKGTVQILTQFLPTSLMTTDIASWIRHLLQAIAAQHVGNRPDRVEPRVRKRRPKPYKLMNQPRHVLRKRLPVNGI